MLNALCNEMLNYLESNILTALQDLNV